MASEQEKQNFLDLLKTNDSFRRAWRSLDHEGRKAILESRPTFTAADAQELDAFDHPSGVSDQITRNEIERAETQTAFWG